jgi:NAD(P)-dependent dehydrogenase (short-subunit alcohol dehydrogenase family)
MTSTPARVLITGASRGLGLEFTRQYLAAGSEVIATCRRPATATGLQSLRADPRLRIEALDVTDHAAVEALARRLSDLTIDVLINNAGDIGPRDPGVTRLHEQQFGTVNYAEWRRVLEVNTLAPVKVAEAFLPQLLAGRERKLVFISSQTGSNSEGRHAVLAYCSSKAALNKIVGMLATTLAAQGVICAALCPGHVKTELGGAGAVLEPAESIAGLRAVIAGLTPADTGCYRDWNGRTIAW